MGEGGSDKHQYAYIIEAQFGPTGEEDIELTASDLMTALNGRIARGGGFIVVEEGREKAAEADGWHGSEEAWFGK
jgi:hypothetical protein